MRKFIFILATVVGLFACSPRVYRTDSLTYTGYRIKQDARKDPAINNMLTKYRDSVNSTMNGVIGNIANNLEKSQPECSLGNFMADAMMYGAGESFKRNVDGAFMNYGGIRLTQISKGPITTGKIFELMPFDNILVLQEMKGSQLKTFLDHISGRGAWPAAGITYDVKDKKAVNIMIKGKPLDENATYTICNSDYVANGGDDCSFLKAIPQINNGTLVRDALLNYVRHQTAMGMSIEAKVEGRVKKVDLP